MGLCTLAAVKIQLGIASGDTSQDALLQMFVADASQYLKGEFKQNYADLIELVTVANPAVVTSRAHGLETGDVVYISHSGTTPSIDGLQTVTWVSPDTFSVPVNVSAIPTEPSGSYCRQYTEYYGGNGSFSLILRQRPVISVQNVWYDNNGYYGQGTPDPFDAVTSLLVQGTDYILKVDSPSSVMKSKCGILLNLKGFWANFPQKTLGLLTEETKTGFGNYKVQYVAGYSPLPRDIELLCRGVVARLMLQKSGFLLESENIEDYSYKLAIEDATNCQIASMGRQLKRYKELAI